MQWPVVSTLCQETKKHRHHKVGSEGTPKLGPYWKLQLAACTANMELRSESCPWTKTILTPGSEIFMAQTSWSRTWATMSRKPQKCSSKNIRWNWMRVIVHVDQRLKQNHKRREPCRFVHKNNTYWGKNLDRCWTRRIFNLRLRSVEEINWIFFVMGVYLEKTMERLNSGE